MPYSRKIAILIAAAVTAAGLFLCSSRFVTSAQARLTYAEINVALLTKLPNDSFKTRAQLIKWISLQVRNRKMDKPLTRDREDDLRQAGATDELIAVIKANSPALATPTPTQLHTVVDLGDLLGRAVNLVKPEYTPEARKAGTNGEVKLALELDTEGKVVSATPLTGLANGLTERAAAAARQSTFTPARIDGKPARGSGILTYNFKINLINIAATLAAADDLRSKAECDRAIIEYTKVIDVDAKQPKAFFGRALCYLTKTNYERAIADLDSAVSLNQGDAEAYLFLAIAHDFRGDPAAAGNFYSKAVSLSPELDKRAVMECLFIERRRMTEDEARAAGNGIINACNKGLRGAPDFLTGLIYVKRGIGYRLKSDYDRAIADFETAQRLNPQFTAVQGHLHSAYNSRGLLYFNKKDYKAAFSDITRAIDLKPQSPTPYINRCVIYLYAWKELDRAIDDCSMAIKFSTKSAMAYVHRGFAYEMKNNLDAAIADYRKALEIDPQNENAQAKLNRIQRPSMKN